MNQRITYNISTINMLIFLTLCFFAYLESNIAILFTSFILLTIAVVFTVIINNFKNIEPPIYIFLLFFCIYLIHSGLVYYGLMNFYETPFVKLDEFFFYRASNNVFEKLQNNYTFFQLDDIYREGTASLYFYGLVATLSNFFDENSILSIKIAVILISSLLPMLVYSISRLYFSEEISIRVAIIYGLFSFVPYLSSVLLRDTQVAFTFLIVFYIILQKKSILNFIILFLVFFIGYYLRPQTGLFMMGFPLIYFFIFIQEIKISKYMKMIIYLVLLVLIVSMILNLGLMEVYEATANSSGNTVSEAKLSGLGGVIAKLPFPINVLAQFGYGQIQPFPPKWIFTGSNKGVFQLSYLIGGIAWFLGWGFLLYGIFVKKILSKIDLKLKLMFFISIVYLLLIASVVFSMRRQMAVYPILYLLMVFSYMEMTISERTKIWIGMGIFYVILVLLLNYIKL